MTTSTARSCCPRRERRSSWRRRTKANVKEREGHTPSSASVPEHESPGLRTRDRVFGTNTIDSGPTRGYARISEPSSIFRSAIANAIGELVPFSSPGSGQPGTVTLWHLGQSALGPRSAWR
jgi:hypothetical protein